ncbi:MAG: flagellin [Lachnospiraceae bacterium]|nr:flagellin [Lachnospiraceae bacterium]
MKINRNMSAVMTNKHLLRTENRLTSSMERLSSGLKINKAGDNPAGLAISKKMKAQIDGLDQAKSNATDGDAVLRTADGALNEVSSILQRIRELSVQAANGTNSYDDRKSVQEEIDKLTEEVDRISQDTEYNTKTLLDGSSDVRVYSTQTERMQVSDTVIPGQYKLDVTLPAEQAEYTFNRPTGTVEGNISINGVTMSYQTGMSEEDFFGALRTAAEQGGCNAERLATGGYRLTTEEYGTDAMMSLEIGKALAEDIGLSGDPDAVYTEDDSTYTLNKKGKDAQIQLQTEEGFSETATVSTKGNRVKITDKGGFSMDFLLKEQIRQEVKIQVTDIGPMSIQIGANQYEDMDVRIPEVSSKSLYLDTVDVTKSGGPEKAMETLDDAIARLNSIRSGIGAFTNRLEYATNSLSETQEDMTSAYSNILDTDMAEEMTEYTQQNILEQASISVLSQANDLPQQVLSLLQ